MNLYLIDSACKMCKIKLTEYELKEKSSLCIECYREENQVERFQVNMKPIRMKNKKFVY